MLASLLLFYVSEQKRKTVVGAAKDSTVTKKAKLLPSISKPTVSNPCKPKKFLVVFTVAETPKTHHCVPIVKRPVIKHSSAAKLASYEVDSNAQSTSGVKVPSVTISTSRKLPKQVENVKIQIIILKQLLIIQVPGLNLDMCIIFHSK